MVHQVQSVEEHCHFTGQRCAESTRVFQEFFGSFGIPRHERAQRCERRLLPLRGGRSREMLDQRPCVRTAASAG